MVEQSLKQFSLLQNIYLEGRAKEMHQHGPCGRAQLTEQRARMQLTCQLFPPTPLGIRQPTKQRRSPCTSHHTDCLFSTRSQEAAPPLPRGRATCNLQPAARRTARPASRSHLLPSCQENNPALFLTKPSPVFLCKLLCSALQFPPGAQRAPVGPSPARPLLVFTAPGPQLGTRRWWHCRAIPSDLPEQGEARVAFQDRVHLQPGSTTT